VPEIDNAGALILAVGIIGATVMPHAIYLHSGLMTNRIPVRTYAERKHLISLSNKEVLFALGFAGLVNMAMVMMAAAAFHHGHNNVDKIETAYRTLSPVLGGAAAGVFLLALIASGLSSAAVGTMAGQIIMQGFLAIRIPLWVRRLVTMLPALGVIAYGADATKALVLSQVILSLVLPVPMIALLVLMRRPNLMGGFIVSRAMTWISTIAACFVIALNALLVAETLGTFFLK
jgi:manganese transport protein